MKCFYCNREIEEGDEVRPLFLIDNGVIYRGIFTHNGECYRGAERVIEGVTGDFIGVVNIMAGATERRRKSWLHYK